MELGPQIAAGHQPGQLLSAGHVGPGRENAIVTPTTRSITFRDYRFFWTKVDHIRAPTLAFVMAAGKAHLTVGVFHSSGTKACDKGIEESSRQIDKQLDRQIDRQIDRQTDRQAPYQRWVVASRADPDQPYA
jgi:hypothetical protein